MTARRRSKRTILSKPAKTGLFLRASNFSRGRVSPFKLRYALFLLFLAGLGVALNAMREQLAPFAARLKNATQELEKPSKEPVMSAWITPPSYTGLSPIQMDSSAAKETIKVPEGSVFTLNLTAEPPAPRLTLNGRKTALKRDKHGDYSAMEPLTEEGTIRLQRGWNVLGAWKVRLTPDAPPRIAFTEPPSVNENKVLRFAYEASDDHGVQDVTLRFTPAPSATGFVRESVDVALVSPQAQRVKQTDSQDLTFLPWTGLPVDVQLFATDAAGRTAASETVSLTLPERQFTHPLARALIEEQKKLMRQPDEMTLDEAASIMAGIARQPISYRGDPAVMMALRSGAVRLVLNRDKDAIAAVRRLLWETAIRIEAGPLGIAQRDLRQAQRDFASALDRNDTNEAVGRAVSRLDKALSHYLEELTAHLARLPSPAHEEGFILGTENRLLMTGDFQNMMKTMRDQAAQGSRDALRRQLLRLQQTVESIRAHPPELTPELQQSFRKMAAFRALIKAQQLLLDLTRHAADGKVAGQKSVLPAPGKIAEQQKGLLTRLRTMTKEAKFTFEGIAVVEDAMNGASDLIQKGDLGKAKEKQQEVIQSLEKGLQAMMEQTRTVMLALSGAKDGLSAEGNGAGSALSAAPENPDAPPPMEREKSPRPPQPDYIDRFIKQLQ